MGKRKPDPDEQFLKLKVPSDMLYLFTYMASSVVNWEQDDLDAYKKLSKKEQQQVLSDYFALIVKKHATARMGENLVISHITDYHVGQRILKDRVEARKVSSVDPQLSK